MQPSDLADKRIAMQRNGKHKTMDKLRLIKIEVISYEIA